MKASSYLIRLTRLLVLGAILAGAVVSAAGARDGRPPVEDAAMALHTTPAGLKAYGERWAGIARIYRDLELARSAPTTQGLRADGLRWQGIADVYKSLSGKIGSNTGPQSTGSTFDWGDWSIGLVAGFGLALGVAGALLLTVSRIPRLRKTGAAAVG